MTDTKPVRIGLVALVVLPIITSLVRSMRNDWFPIGDNALLFIRTRDVFTEHHPFLGSWTSASLSVGENMNNPGSMYDFLIAPFAHLLSPGPAAALGVATVNLVAVIGIAIASRRVGGWTLERAVLAVTAVLAWSMGSELLIDIWQANALILPFMLFLVLIVGSSVGTRGVIPWTVAVGSLLLQTHISYAYIFVFLVGAALGIWLWNTRQRQDITVPEALRAGLRSRSMFTSVAVFAVLWSQPVVEQLFGDGKGNLARLLGNSGGGTLSLGPRDATRIVAAVSAFPTWWSRGAYTTTVPITRLTEVDGSEQLLIPGLPGTFGAVLGLLTVVAVLVALIRLAHRAGLQVQVAAGVMSLSGLVGAVASISLLTIGRVGLSPHHVRFIWPLIAFVHVMIVWIAVSVWKERAQPSVVAAARRWSTPTVAAFIALFTVLNLPYHAQSSGPVAAYDAMPVMRRIEPEIDQLRDRGPVLFDVSNLVIFEPYSSTMMMWMQERGIEFRVDDEIHIRQLGNNRRANGTEATRVFQLQGIDALTYSGPACIVGIASLLSPADETTARADAEAIADAVIAETITIGEQAVDADDLLSVAVAGDRNATFEKVLDGTIPALIRDGGASISESVDPDLLSGATFDRIGAWAFSSYALFADTLTAPCT